MDNACASMCQHERLAELDIVESAVARAYTLVRRTDEVDRTRVRVSRELLAFAGARTADGRRATSPPRAFSS